MIGIVALIFVFAAVASSDVPTTMRDCIIGCRANQTVTFRECMMDCRYTIFHGPDRRSFSSPRKNK